MSIPSIEEIRRKNPIKTIYDPFVYFPTHISLYVVRLLYPFKITPNQVSLVSYVLYVLGAVLISINKYIVFALILLQIVIILDGADGRLARTKKQVTFMGKFYECVTHETCPPILFFAVGSYLFVTLKNPIYLYLGGIILISRLLINSVGTSKERIAYQYINNIKKTDNRILVRTKSNFLHLIINLITVLSNLPFSIWMVTLGIIFGYLKYVLIFYTLYFGVISIFKIFVELKIGFKIYGVKE